jgi:hypothetical protein
VTVGGAAFWLAGSNDDNDSCSSSFERNRGYMTKAEPLLYQYEAASVLQHDDRPLFGHTTVIAGNPQHQPPAKETVVATATTTAATAGVKPHTVRSTASTIFGGGDTTMSSSPPFSIANGLPSSIHVHTCTIFDRSQSERSRMRALPWKMNIAFTIIPFMRFLTVTVVVVYRNI